MCVELRDIRPLIHSGSDDLESFMAWSEQIKLEMSECNPLLYEVLGNIAFSRQPLAGGDSFKTRRVQASFLEQKSHQNSGEDRAKEARELQIRNKGRQLGCLLVQTTKGQTQLQVTKWLSATNGWEAWRQLNLSFLSRLLASLLLISLDDDQPASCMQPVLAWKERAVEHQELSVSSLNMLAIETCQTEQEELGEHNRVDFQENSLQQQQKQDKPDKLVEGGQGGAYRPQPTAQSREARGSTSFPTAGKELAKPSEKSLDKQAEPSEKSLDKEAKKGDENNKKKAKLTVPSLEPTKARGSTSFPTARAELAETSSNQKEARASLHGATTAGRQGRPPKLTGGPPAPSNKSTNRRTLCAARAERSSFKETTETNLLLSGWLPTKVS